MLFTLKAWVVLALFLLLPLFRTVRRHSTEGRMEESATPTNSTAPATSGAPSGETTRPTMAQAFASNPVESASPADDTASELDSVEQPASATTAPTETIAPAVTPAPGPIPFERHKSILDGAYKERDSAKSELTALRAQIESPGFKEFQDLAGLFRQDIREFKRRVDQELEARHPELADELATEAARRLSARRKANAPIAPQSMDPDIPVYDETGKLVAQTFSADKVKAIVTTAVNEALQREVGPIKQDFTKRKEAEEFAEITRAADHTAHQHFEAAKKWPGFLSDPANGTVDPDVVKAFAEHPDWDLRETYINVVVPKLGARKEAEVLDSLKTKAAAASGVNPSGAVVATTRRVTRLTDPSLQW